MHNMRDRSCFSLTTCKPIHKEFDQAVLDAVAVLDVWAYRYPASCR